MKKRNRSRRKGERVLIMDHGKISQRMKSGTKYGEYHKGEEMSRKEDNGVE